MSKKLREWISYDTIPYIILVTLFVFISIRMRTNYADDVVYRKTKLDALGFVVDYYKRWGSPSLITIISVYLVHWPDIIFKICNILVVLLAGYSINKITFSEKSKYQKWVTVLLITLYPIIEMKTAGWISTSTTYLFPLSCALYSFIYLRLVIDNKEISYLKYILFWIALILGAGGVQLSFVILGIYLVFNIFFAIKRKIYKFSILQNITALLFTLYHLTAPGNANRSIQEIIAWFPDFNMISSVNRIKLGYTSTLGELISTPNIFFLCFSFLLIVGVCCKYKENLYRLISLIPFVSSLLFGTATRISAKIFPRLLGLMNNGDADFVQINLYNFSHKVNYLSIIIGFIIIGAILISIYLIFENTLKMLIVEAIFLAGFSSRMIMSFSPTIYASNTRTFIFLYFAMIVCGTFIFNIISENITEEWQKRVLLCIGIIAAINYFKLIISI